MAVTININNLSLCHKGSGGISTATLPDVCKTPTPGGPVPMPYPNIAFARDLARGTRTITADGGNMCANYGSRFSRSTGDEPGTLGGVKSGTVRAEATWITYSFDVRLEGKGACRLTDKMFHNRANTVNLAGLVQRMLQASALLQNMLCDCDREIGRGGPKDTCLSLGNKKHDCMERKQAEHNARGGQPRLDGERGYNYKTGKPDTHPLKRSERFRRLAALRKQIKAAKAAVAVTQATAKVSKASKLVKLTPVTFVVGLAVDVGVDFALDKALKQLTKLTAEADSLGKSLKDTIFPDGAVRGPDGRIDGFLDYKFGCPEGVKSGKGFSTGTNEATWTPGQKERVEELIESLPETEVNPKARASLLTNAKC